jgi:hypothetical protein
LEAAAGTSVSLAAITAAVEENKPAMVFLVQGESSTGVHQNLAGVGELCRKHGALLVRQGSDPSISMTDCTSFPCHLVRGALSLALIAGGWNSLGRASGQGYQVSLLNLDGVSFMIPVPVCRTEVFSSRGVALGQVGMANCVRIQSCLDTPQQRLNVRLLQG